MMYVALTEIGDIKGMPEVSDTLLRPVYGAMVKEIKKEVPYFTTTVSRIVEAPWLGQPHVQTYMNTIKRLNEQPVKDYRDLELSSVPTQTHETYVPPENFDPLNGSPNVGLFILLALAVILVCVIYGM